MTFFRALVAIIVIAGGMLGTLANQSPVSAQSPVAYIALGDSIAYGIGSSLPDRRGYPPQVHDFIEQATGDMVMLSNLAVPGETAASFLTSGQVDELADTRRRLQEQNAPISLVTVSLGGNEMLAQRYSGVVERQQALAEFRDSLDIALSRIREEVGSSPDMVLTTYYDLSEGDPAAQSSDAWWIAQFNAVIRETAERHDAVVADVNEAFEGNISSFTLHPYDVHPKNQGYRAIAEQVWSALGWDTTAPGIQVLSDATTTRRTPTLQMEVTDNIAVASVSVVVGDGEPEHAVHVGDGRYVLLLDLRDSDETWYQITIEASDAAGNVSRMDVQLVVETN